jgi:ribonucleoside-diphosphate reductase beta chain
MAKIFNLQRKKTENLFLDGQLGLQDYVNVQYPILEELAQKQRSQFWIETEISLDQDFKQWPTLPEGVRNTTLKNLAWQLQGDSIAGRAPQAILGPLMSNPELENMVMQWTYFETIHSRAYSNIIRSVLPNPAEFIDSVAEDVKSFARLESIVKIFDRLYNATPAWLDLSEQYENGEVQDLDAYQQELENMQELLLDFYYAVYALEAVQFYASFACTFGLAEQDILSGIAGNLVLIAKDEALHTQMSCETLKILKTQVPPHVWDASTQRAPKILLEVLEAEIEWAQYILDEDTRIIGLNSDLLTEYLYFVSRNAFAAIGLQWPEGYPVVTQHPIPWIEYYLDTSKTQVAPQETQKKDYKVGSIIGSTSESVDNLNEEFGEWL